MLTETQKEYNNLLRRWDEAEKYLNNEKVPMQERERWVNHAASLAINLSQLLNKIKIYQQEDVWLGFGDKTSQLLNIDNIVN
jgi:hypothetical protein